MPPVIAATRLDDTPLVVNADLIVTVEQAHDTILTLVGGDKIAVRETADEIVRRVVAYRRRIAPAVRIAPPDPEQEPEPHPDPAAGE